MRGAVDGIGYSTMEGKELWARNKAQGGKERIGAISRVDIDTGKRKGLEELVTSAYRACGGVSE